MVDIHSHILPGIDDGPRRMEECIEMLRMAEADGIDEIAATPHVMTRWDTAIADKIVTVYHAVIEKAEELELNIAISLGSEVYITPDIEFARDHIPATYNGNGKFILVELGFNNIPFGCTEIVGHWRDEGIIPVIAHPERNRKIIDSTKIARELSLAGALLQVNSGSILGEFGADVKKTALDLFDNDLIFSVASDAHNAVSRPPVLSIVRNYIESISDIETADALTEKNPRSILGRS